MLHLGLGSHELISHHTTWGQHARSGHNSSGATSTHTLTREHKVHIHIEGSVHLLLSLLHILLLDVFGGLLDSLDTSAQVLDELDEVRHHILLKTLSPCDFKSNIRLDQLVASVKHSSQQFLILHVHDVAEEILSEGRVFRFCYTLHSIFKEFVLLRNLDGLLVLLALAVEESSDASALKQLVVLKVTGELKGLK